MKKATNKPDPRMAGGRGGPGGAWGGGFAGRGGGRGRGARGRGGNFFFSFHIHLQRIDNCLVLLLNYRRCFAHFKTNVKVLC